MTKYGFKETRIVWVKYKIGIVKYDCVGVCNSEYENGGKEE